MPDGTGISDFAVEIVLEDFLIAYSDEFTNPTTVWAAHYGSYTITNPNSWFDLEVYGDDPGKIEFTPTSMVITNVTQLPIKHYQFGDDIDGESANDYFGKAVSLSADGSIVAIGAPGYERHVGDGDRGQVRIFQWNGSSWSQLGSGIDGEFKNDYFGDAVSLSADGSVVAIGAPYNDGNDAGSGSICIFQWDGSSWNQLGNDIDGEASQDNFGSQSP